MRRDAPRPAAGFTLFEITIALTLAGVAMAGAVLLLDVAGASSERTLERVAAESRAANADRVLRETLRMLEVGAEGAYTFSGNAGHASFSSSCAVPGGWLEQCRVELVVASEDRVPHVTLAFSTGGSVRVMDARRNIRLQFLRSPDDGGAWQDSWPTSVVAPVALGIVADDRLVIVPIGGRW